MKYIFIILTCLTFSKEMEHHFKIGTGISYLNNVTNINSFSENYTCCGEFSDNSSFAQYFNLNYGISIIDRLDLSLNLRYLQNNYFFKNTLPELINVNGENFEGEIGYFLDYNFNQYSLSFGLEYEILKHFYSSIHLGMVIPTEIRLNGYEEILKPSDRGTFKIDDTTFSRIRNDFQSIKDISSPILLNINLSYAFEIKRDYSFELRPNLNFQYINNSLIDNDEWSQINLSAGIDLVVYLNRQNPDNYFAKELFTDEFLFVTAFPMSKTELPLNEFQMIEKSISNWLIDELNGIDSTFNTRDIESTYPGLKFIIDYSHLENLQEIELIINSNEFTQKIIFENGQSKFNLNFKDSDLLLFGDSLEYQLKVETKEKVNLSKPIKRVLNRKYQNYSKLIIQNPSNTNKKRYELIEYHNSNVYYSKESNLDFIPIDLKSKFNYILDLNIPKNQIVFIKRLS